MEITLISVGRLKESYLQAGVQFYQKQLAKYCTFHSIELKDEKTDENNSPAQDLSVKEKEGALILKSIPDRAYVVALSIDGHPLDTDQFTEKLRSIKESGRRNITFIIGGSLGLSPDVLKRANYELSFSPMTFPHQLMRLIFMEQLAACAGRIYL